MTLKNPAAFEFLQSRRSRPAKTLMAPAPTRDELIPLLIAAARNPDHGKLEPWRFIVIEKGAMPRLADLTEERGVALGKSPEDIAKARSQFDMGHLAVAVIEVQKPSPKIPGIEQTYSAGAVCLALLNALVQLARRELGERERVSRCVRWRLVICELPLIINITKRFG